MIADVHFLAVPDVCMANGHYLLRGDTFDIDDYKVHTAEALKVTHDLDQIRTVPYFDGYDTVNLVVFEEGERLVWYWVVGVTYSTLKNGSLDFNLSYCAPTDLYMAGDDLDGLFTRYPENVSKYLKDTITDDALENRRFDRLETWWDDVPIDCKVGYSTRTRLFWVEVTSTRNLVTENNSDMIRYGFPCIFDLDKPEFRAKHIKSGVTVGNEPVWFPDLLDFIANPERFLLPADSILNVSISPICPYGNTITSDNGTPVISISCKDQTGASASPLVVDDQGQPDYPGALTKTYYALCMLDAHDIVESGNEIRTYPVSAPWRSGTMQLTEMQRMTGTVSVCDQRAEPNANLPTELFEHETDYDLNELTYSYKVVSDYSGLYLHLILDDYEDKVIVMPCGKLPWIGDAWEQYKFREQATDREAADYAIENAKQEALQGLIQAGVGMVSGGAAARYGGTGFGAAMGAQMIGQAVNQGLTAYFNVENVTRAQRQNLKLTEHMMKNSAGTGYSTGYGLIYVVECCAIGYGILLQMPANLTVAYFDEYVAEHGYPCEGLVRGIAQPGFYQGRILPTATGIRAERLVDLFNAGLKFVLKD